jgi:hypothetical protein
MARLRRWQLLFNLMKKAAEWVGGAAEMPRFMNGWKRREQWFHAGVRAVRKYRDQPDKAPSANPGREPIYAIKVLRL